MTKFRNLLTLLVLVAVFGSACDRPINIFTVDQDKQLGAQLEAEIANDPTQYPLLSETQYPTAYAYLLDMRDEILKSPEVKYKDKFDWKLKIIHDDATLNAFCAPGGYIYVYTGLMKYLDEVDHLAGVLAHEIAHADQRHSTASMTEKYGIDMLIAIASNNATAAQLSQVAGGLTELGFSRAHETDADEHSVDYLQSSKYACNGAAGFFTKLIAQGQTSGTPAFLSTHPNPDNRVAKINERATELGCSTTSFHSSGDNGAYAAMIATLP
ncbi:M48 family metalloprotease [Aureispira anguillae]|uniref:M48 family metalloprotease n=1 Tax=Aureispira anguillae TaxID=2864201 RepID=A0A915YKC7_9BACT|nr:M48 family metalloprotease [Aureispira anguillae]BDS14403.1 M48 family metalloprotease [Aureispira anguillae]